MNEPRGRAAMHWLGHAGETGAWVRESLNLRGALTRGGIMTARPWYSVTLALREAAKVRPPFKSVRYRRHKRFSNQRDSGNLSPGRQYFIEGLSVDWSTGRCPRTILNLKLPIG